MTKKEESPEQAEKRRAELYAQIEKLAREAEPAALARRSAIMAEAATEYEKQTAGFAFECSKWGSFLRISTKRLGNPFTGKYGATGFGGPGQSFSTALNRENITTITLKPGHGPDMEGDLSYGFYMERKGGGESLSGYATLDPEWEPKIHANYPYIPSLREHFAAKAGDSRNVHYMSSGDYDIRFRTPQYARVSTDDRIVFGGMGATLFVPAGRGEAVLDQILGAT